MKNHIQVFIAFLLFGSALLFSLFFSPALVFIGMKVSKFGTFGMIAGWLLIFAAVPGILNIISTQTKLMLGDSFWIKAGVMAYNTAMFTVFLNLA